MEDYDKIKKTLAVAFMHDLDANRPEGKMCLSNGECADIEKAFNEQDWSKLARYLDKYTESEDEIHRKWILEYLYDGLRKADEQFKDHFKSAIDWLERQKDAFENGRQLGIMQEQARQELEWPDEKQKEQKPDIEICPHSIKSKSYKENGYPIEDCDYGLEIALSILEKTLGEVQGFQTDDGIREHQTAIKAVKDAMKEQKPAEWSEEDERILKGIIGKIDHDQTYGVSKVEMLSFLKSLHPSWKPSEEQMKGLKFFLDFHRPQRNAGTTNWKEFDAVESLYEQLKKF